MARASPSSACTCIATGGCCGGWKQPWTSVPAPGLTASRCASWRHRHGSWPERNPPWPAGSAAGLPSRGSRRRACSSGGRQAPGRAGRAGPQVASRSSSARTAAWLRLRSRVAVRSVTGPLAARARSLASASLWPGAASSAV